MKVTPMISSHLLRITLLVVCCLHIQVLWSQSWSLKVCDSGSNDTSSFIFSSKQEAIREVSSIYYRSLDEGFLLSEIDTVIADSTIFLLLKRHQKFVLNEAHVFHDSSWFGDSRVRGELTLNSLNGLFSKTIADYENEGYPFASIFLDSLSTLSSRRKSELRADVFMSVKAGQRIVNDSLYVRSSQPLPYTYLSNYIDFKSGALYNEQRMQQTEKRLREIPFVQVKRWPEVRFEQGKADLFLFVERKKANYFNGVAGLRPDEATGKTNVTGDAEVRLVNAFNRGEEFGVIWRKLQPLTQDLAVRAMVPYLFKTPLAIDGKLQIYKRDTSFTSVKLMAGAGVILPRNQRIRVFVERNRTDRLTNFYTAGDLANAQHTLYGLSAQLETLDYRWNPRRGFTLQIEGATGYRVTSQPNAEDVAFARKPLTRADALAEFYIPVFKRQTLLFGMKGAVIMSDSLYENEVYRIGGLRTIRGINEESIFATAWAVGTFEYRWLLEENSALFVFVDQAWYEYKGILGYVRDLPINVGAGANFETKAGIFTFNYALGKQFDNPVLVRNGKISFGFRSLF
jgi:outer membrane protein assembly factor BamA